MSNLSRFMEYAAAFEQTFKDDDWTRLAPFFTEDAHYQVSGVPFGCEIDGRDNIFAGMKKSLNGFDRKMAKRHIVPTAPPKEVDGRVMLDGYVTYQREGTPPIDLQASIVVEFDGNRICRMHDTFVLDDAAKAWLGAHARDLDGSYV